MKFKPIMTAALVAGTALSALPAAAGPDAIKVGLLMDMTGNYSDVAGRGSVTAAEMAVEDFGGTVLGKPIEVVHADMQNKVDIATSIAREWFDVDAVDAIVDSNMSSAGLAVSEIAVEKDRLMIMNISGSPRFTNESCNPNTIHYVYDTYALATSTGKAVVRGGGDKWFFVTVDYTFGHDFQAQAEDAVASEGGETVGSVLVPLNASDYSSALILAQSSDANVIAFATAGADTSNAIKQAAEFGIGQGDDRQLAGLLVYINEVDALGLETAQGMLLTSAFYWDLDEETRAFSERYMEKMGKMPNMSQAGVYSSTMHYLKAVEAAGTDESDAVREAMGNKPIDDFFAQGGTIRDDGLLEHDMYLLKAKQPSESEGTWDLATIERTIPGDRAYASLAESGCQRVAE